MRCPDLEDFDTYERALARLEATEGLLAARLGLRGDVRETLLRLAREGKLVEDEIVADWHQHYSSYIDWLQNPDDSVPPAVKIPVLLEGCRDIDWHLEEDERSF